MTQYTIKKGDTLSAIARTFGVSLAALEAANPGINPNNLQIGQIISVPGTMVVTEYTIRKGDTFAALAQRFGISLAALEAANPGLNPNNLQIGQIINVPGAAPPTPPTPPIGNGYVNYGGPASAFPNPKLWATFDTLWAQNTPLMKYHDSDAEIQDIHNSISTVAAESGIDRRVIVCIIMQESGGDVRIPTTNNGIRNPGLMQSHNGAEFNPANPAGSILQMIRDGTEGTSSGDGLKQCLARYGNYYAAFRDYNSGRVDVNDLNNPEGATGSYVRDAANRLMGHVWAGM